MPESSDFTSSYGNSGKCHFNCDKSILFMSYLWLIYNNYKHLSGKKTKTLTSPGEPPD